MEATFNPKKNLWTIYIQPQKKTTEATLRCKGKIQTDVYKVDLQAYKASPRSVYAPVHFRYSRRSPNPLCSEEA